MGALRSGICRALALGAAMFGLAACASVEPRYAAEPNAGAKPSPRYSGYHVGQPYEVNGRWYTPSDQPDYDETGLASWYGEQFHNRYTADGEVFDMGLVSAAHKTLPLPSLVEVTNLANGRKLVVRVNDRGPFVDGRIIDLSREAAAQLGFLTQGLAQVRVRYVGRAPDLPGGAQLYEVKTAPPPIPAAPRPTVQVAAAARTPPAMQIDDVPVQSSPTNVAWTAPVSSKPPPPPPATTVAVAGSDIDSVLAQLASAPPSSPAASPVLVQAGVYATRFNAEIAAAKIGGRTEILPFEQDGRLLYKVFAERK